MKKVCQHNRIMNEIAYDEKNSLFACILQTTLQVSHSLQNHFVQLLKQCIFVRWRLKFQAPSAVFRSLPSRNVCMSQ